VLIDQLAAESPENLDDTQAQVHVHAKLGVVLQRLKRPGDAEARYRKAIALGGSLIERSPRPARARFDRADVEEILARLQLERGQRDEARSLLDAAAADLQFLVTGIQRALPLEDRFESLAEVYRQLGETERAEDMGRWAQKAAVRHSQPGREPPGPGPPAPQPTEEQPWAPAASRSGPT
jgi:tetratricopeptide (TPR) repeat protein